MNLKEIGRRVALERSHTGLTQRELADRAELSQSTLNRIEAGERGALTLAELDRIAMALDVSLTRLTRGNPVGERMKVAARAGQRMCDELRSASRIAEEILALDDRMDAFELPTGMREPGRLAELSCRLPSEALSAEDQGRLLAEAVREKLTLGLGPVLDLAELAESPMGLDTAALALPDGVSGITARDPGRGVVLVLINTAEVPERQRFTLAHEVGHVLFGDGADAHLLDGEPTPAETRCNSFARHLLAPARGVERWLAEHTGGTPGLKECAMAARHYEVSLKVILIQCQKLGLLTTGAAESLCGRTGRQLAWAFGWGPQYAAACDAAARVRPPRRILERAVEAYRTGRIGVRAVAALGGEDPRTTERELHEAGITPPAVGPPRRVDVASVIARRAGWRDAVADPPAPGNEDGDLQG